MRILLVVLALTVMANTVSANDQLMCPTLSDANIRLTLRLQFLITKWEETKNKDERGLSVSAAPDLALAITHVVAARAKEEARIWLIQQLTDQICKSSSSSRPYFPNTCSAVNYVNAYPGPSLSVLRTQFKRDIYAIPACYSFLSNAITSSPSAENDTAIDSYIAEAALLAIYLRTNGGNEANPDAPSLGSNQQSSVEALASALVFAMTAKYKWWELTRSAVNNTNACSSPTKNDIPKLLTTVAHAINANGVKGSPEAALRVIKDFYIRKKCTEVVADIQAVSDAFYNAVRGNYLETTLSAANDFLCNKSDAPRYCSRLPLIGEIASAKTQAEMESSLDHAIEPVGSWKRKQSEPLWSLDAMIGIAGGVESLQVQGANVRQMTTGLFLPIGIERSWPVGGGYGSLTFGISMLDLGAMLSYSSQTGLDGGQTSTAANAKWSSLAAPGFYIAYGIKNSPLRWGFTVSRTPELRSVDLAGGITHKADSTRYLLFLTADITLFAF
jgi:hypothetical protein